MTDGTAIPKKKDAHSARLIHFQMEHPGKLAAMCALPATRAGNNPAHLFRHARQDTLHLLGITDIDQQ